MKDIANLRFGRLLVIKRAPARGLMCMWQCRCDCGTVKDICGSSLRRGLTSSCGCVHREIMRQRNTKHGFWAPDRSKMQAKVYQTWQDVLNRCRNPNVDSYPIYGGRGIRVAEEWVLDFKRFLRDVGFPPTLKHSIDRIDSDGNYEPGNVKWSTLKEQGRNKRNNKWVTIDGVRRCVAEWSELTGINYGTLQSRIRLGWTADELFSPVRRIS